MSQIASKLREVIGRNLRKPEATLIGRIIKKYGLEKKNRVIELEAVRLCDVQPDYKVLEVGFGPGIGIEATYNIIKGGNGKVYGVDFSEEMVESATKRVNEGISNGKVELHHADVANMSFLKSNSFDRVFHCNCYYFWPDLTLAVNELNRVMKPGAVMVTTMNYERLKKIQSKGYFDKCGNIDMNRYLSALQSGGFQEVKLKSFKHESSGINIEAIIAQKLEN
ncbi:uncharacterized methyltransferase YdaC-like [Ylistrum balloti]|uniref:uncharacterized methyltransferase YdaC-like n=1 Tax=Ylistrum balloti TaxID=509963 RepID=UPI002905EE52|nr:uncharacterized methyltransferase YdaC-like [Ylistrum balloti]